MIRIVNHFLDFRNALLEQGFNSVLHGHARAGASFASALKLQNNHTVLNFCNGCPAAMGSQRRADLFFHNRIYRFQDFLICHNDTLLFDMNLTSQCFTPTTFDLIKARTGTQISMKTYILNILKGMLMGAANVIPGVSGGTMALLTGIFEKLIDTIKAFDIKTLKLASQFKFKELFEHINILFLSAVGIGVIGSILTFARVLEYLFDHQALYVWAFFFGLILASVYFVGKKIGRVCGSVVFLFILGTAIAGGIAFMKPAAENASIPYLLLCGAIAMCSMILPGLSGSYVLLLMGNYQLVMISAVSGFKLDILIPVGIGAAAGLAIFARLLSWIFKKFHDQTLALLTGFILGSLSILWPWKTAIEQPFGEKTKVIGYDYSLPSLNTETGIAIAIMLAGIIAIALIEGAASKLKND